MSRLFILSDESPLQLILPIFNNVSSLSSNSRGVAILFRNTFQYHIEKEIKDSDGNFIILSFRINDTLWTLVAAKFYIVTPF
jgi:hypothetical protein